MPTLFTKPARRKTAAAFAALLVLSSVSSISYAAPTKDNTAVDATMKKVIALADQDKSDSAVDLGNQAIKTAPDYWLPYAVVSVVEWRRGKLQNGLKQAKEAVRLSPDSELTNLNFAIMNQQLGYFETAIPGFKKAMKAAPNDWIPRLGLVHALIGTSNSAEAINVLDQMSTKTDGNFDWWYHLADGYSILKKSKQAADAAQHAVAAATTPETKTKARATLLVELVRANELDKAHAVKADLLNAKIKQGNVYTCCLDSLCDAKDPSYGRTIIDTAINAGVADADDFFKLGQISEQKASTAGLDSNTRNAWLDNAEAAYKTANKILPGDLKSLLGLAGVADRKGKKDEMLGYLAKVKSMTSTDALVPYLMARVKASGNDLAGKLRESLTGEQEKPYQLNLVKEDFQMDNLQCNCHLGAIAYQLKQQNGVKFVAITNKEKPIKGMLLVDQAYGSSEAIANVVKSEPKLTIKPLTTTPVLTVSDAIRLSQSTPDATQVSMTWSFTTEPPKMPVI
ncbi:MAG TPA: hypothetical protein V6C76_14260 [Drouetiella sp.]